MSDERQDRTRSTTRGRATLRSADVDLVVIGAGIAGLAATKTARAEGLSVALIEASDRVGGRAHTDTDTLGLPFDRGCHWLHNARHNPFRALADRWGFVYRKAAIERRTHLGDRWATAAEERARERFEDEASARIDAVGAAGLDVPASEPLAALRERASPWEPVFTRFFTAVMGAPPERCSSLDFYNYEDGGDYPVRDGFGTLVARYAEGVDVSLETPARALDWSGAGVVVDTLRGRITARAAIVTVPTSVLAAGVIRFTPQLPAWKLAAIDGLPMGHTNKIALKFDRDVLGEDFGVPENAALELRPGAPQVPGFELRPFGRALAIAHVAGSLAQELERAGPLAMVSFARDQLRIAFGSKVQERLVAHATTAWSSAPWTLGAFSTAAPGRAAAREEYARPLAERLFFAGDAASVDAFGSAHGALESGITAARAAIDRVRLL
ncbi:MAG: FAD-dependent oxidoreductase [Myxococcales bacterium]|nr:FAD-dependent oxidoreductase [Myxococcales bacterium]MCB9751148.1 FAD-dependent oxidoreductase [Myxococcales bacterium]